jgi:hypothetical protein
MIESASQQMTTLLDRLAVAARIEGGRYEPTAREADSLELVREAADAADGDVVVTGNGTTVSVDPDSMRDALASLAVCVLRHGPVEQVSLAVDGPDVVLGPVPDAAGPIAMGDDMRDLGAAVAVRVVRAQGGSVELGGGQLHIALPQ